MVEFLIQNFWAILFILTLAINKKYIYALILLLWEMKFGFDFRMFASVFIVLLLESFFKTSSEE